MLLAATTGGMLHAGNGDTLSWRTLDYIRLGEAWLSSENAAGLRTFGEGSLSEVELYIDKQNGKFANFGGSDNSFEVGAGTESFYRLSRKVVFYGKVDYRHFSGLHMAGSYFIDPEHAPFDIVESTDDNRGTKKLETYHLAGAVSVDVGKNWSVGGKLDYTAANYAKRKDLRHVNNLMDMYLTAGILWKPVEWLEAGADYYYRRRTEGLLLDTYGTTDQTYNSLISYGAFFGKTEQFGENGYTKENEEKPLFDQYHGGSAQLKWEILPGSLSLFVEGGYKTRSGYYGKKSPSTVVYSEHDSRIRMAEATLLWKQGRNLHHLQAAWQKEALANRENIYRSENEGGGLSNVNYYGTLDTTDKTLETWNVVYTGNFGIVADCPVWTVEACLSRYSRELKASVYPFYRRQKLDQTSVNVAGQHNFMKGTRLFSIRIEGGYAGGSGAPFRDGTYTTISSSQSEPDGMETYLYREYEFITCKRMNAALTVRYAQDIGHKKLKAYTSLRYALVKAFNIDYIEGDMRHRLTWTVGCNF